MQEILARAVELEVSDVHITVGVPPVFRIDGELVSQQSWKTIGAPDSEQLAEEIMTKTQLDTLREEKEVDFAFSLPGMGRFRVNVFYQRGNSVGLAIRPISNAIRQLDGLGLPAIIGSFTRINDGLVLVTGPSGSGKSTTQAAMIDEINRSRSCHIITLEDPIEYVHSHQRSVVNQREVGSDTKSFALGLRAALRQNPDVILVGEMRDLETIGIALTAAETGHLVLGTLHTRSAAETVDRIIDVFPPHQQEQIRVQLAATLKGVISQRLVPRADMPGRKPAVETLVVNPAVGNLIRKAKAFQIPTVIQTGAKEGMQTMEAALKRLFESGEISGETMLKHLPNPVTAADMD